MIWISRSSTGLRIIVIVVMCKKINKGFRIEYFIQTQSKTFLIHRLFYVGNYIHGEYYHIISNIRNSTKNSEPQCSLFLFYFV